MSRPAASTEKDIGENMSKERVTSKKRDRKNVTTSPLQTKDAFEGGHSKLPAKGGSAKKRMHPQHAPSAKPQKSKPALVGEDLKWLQLGSEERDSAEKCGVDKDLQQASRRKSTGGILTAVLSCGFLANWLEIPRGESLELVYSPESSDPALFHKEKIDTRRLKVV